MSIYNSQTSADQSRTLEFRPEKLFYGKRLMNHVIRITKVMVLEFCEILCYIEPDCVCINIDKREDGHVVYKCELNNVTHEGYEQELVDDENYFYHASKVDFSLN